VAEGEIGEVVVTTLNPDYPLIRFATGDMSAIMSGQSPCGRTNTRIRGWMGRADQTAKIKGMFVRPEQVATLVERHNEVSKIRVVVSRDGEADKMHVMCEVGSGANVNAIEASVRDVLKLRGDVFLQNIGSLPNDGKVIDDQRNYD
jgi:phenylacetate-CoA ligase